MSEERCFVTGKPIPEDELEHARRTKTFEAWVSDEGQKMLENDGETAANFPHLVKVMEEWAAEESDWYTQWQEQQGKEP